MSIDEAFKKYTKVETYGEYGYKIYCVRGLWSVNEVDKESAEVWAMTYFRWYFSKGKYGDWNIEKMRQL